MVFLELTVYFSAINISGNLKYWTSKFNVINSILLLHVYIIICISDRVHLVYGNQYLIITVSISQVISNIGQVNELYTGTKYSIIFSEEMDP